MTVAPEARPTQGAGRSDQVQTLFSEIAPRYDLLNHVLSMNIDRRWRRKAVRSLGWEEDPEGLYLDGCAGTFDLSLELARQPGFAGRVVAADFAFPMLDAGRDKIRGTPVDAVCGDALRLPFSDGAFSGITIGFGVRNLSDLEAGLEECARVLKPGGRLVILEFTVPPNRLVRRAYMLYFNHVLPRIGRIVSGHPWAYTYLPESVKEFPDVKGLGMRMEAAGLAPATWTLVTGGIAAIHVGTKAGRPEQ
ncbi:MAG: class I SAM-dependent methyltransferase [Gemmatimonadetes bacterium]|nr:class I SAM-dependent methyltransferase [Gemmatimonadota bacterium]